jgi:hypothetical protein
LPVGPYYKEKPGISFESLRIKFFSVEEYNTEVSLSGLKLFDPWQGVSSSVTLSLTKRERPRMFARN